MERSQEQDPNAVQLLDTKDLFCTGIREAMSDTNYRENPALMEMILSLHSANSDIFQYCDEQTVIYEMVRFLVLSKMMTAPTGSSLSPDASHNITQYIARFNAVMLPTNNAVLNLLQSLRLVSGNLNSRRKGVELSKSNERVWRKRTSSTLCNVSLTDLSVYNQLDFRAWASRDGTANGTLSECARYALCEWMSRETVQKNFLPNRSKSRMCHSSSWDYQMAHAKASRPKPRSPNKARVARSSTESDGHKLLLVRDANDLSECLERFLI